MAKKEEAPAGAPEWVVTYGDMMSLLLVFFIALVSMSEMKQDKFQQALQSLHQAFGGFDGGLGTLPVETDSTNSLIEQLLQLDVPMDMNQKSDPDDEAVEGKKYNVASVRDGLKVVVGGQIAFERFGAELRPEARDLVEKTAEKIRGNNTRIMVRGHATNEPLPEGSTFADARDLSYVRAKAVIAVLEAAGVHPDRLIPVAVGDAEPCARQAYSEERRALNRRVEILVTEDLITDYAGEPAKP